MNDKYSKKTNNVYLDNYPVSTIIITNFVSLATYGIGAYIMYSIGVISLAIYLVVIIGLEILLYIKSCKHCYYFGKLCAFGKGKIACHVTKKGDSDVFVKRPVSWRSVVPDILVTLIPMITAVVLMIVDFHWIQPVMLVLLILFMSVGNSYVRGHRACKYCRQRELG